MKESKIIRNLSFSFALLIIVCVFMAGLEIFVFKKIESVTNNIYNHPLQVSNAVKTVQVEMYKIHNNIKNIILLSNAKDEDSRINGFISQIETSEKIMFLNLGIVKEKILGTEGKELEKSVRENYRSWKNINSEALGFVKTKRYDMALKIMQESGAEQEEHCFMALQELFLYTQKEAETFMSDFQKYIELIYFKYKYYLPGLIILLSLLTWFTLKKVAYYIKSHNESQEKFKLIFDNAMDGIAIADIKTKTFLTGNRAICRMLGYTHEEFIKLGVMDIHPKEELSYVIEQFEKQAKREIALAKDIPVLRKDGSVFYADVMSSPIELDSGRYLIGVFRDVTETEKLLNQLKSSKKMYKELVESINVMVWEHDTEGRFTYVSPKSEEITGYKPEELLGKTPFDLMPAETAEIKREFFQTNVKKRVATFNLEDELIHKSGKSVTVSTSISAVFDKAGEISSFKGVTTDVTAQRELENELKEKEELMLVQSRQAAMGDMIAMIAHQWRQPITVIAMAANNIKLDIELENEITTARLQKMADLVSDQTQHLSKTIDDFRDFFKPNKKRVETSVCEVLQSAMKIVGKSLENNNIEVKIRCESEKRIPIYANELLQVFLNILSNAKDALLEKNREDAKITILIAEEDDMIKTAICDNAGGIAEEAMKKIAVAYFTTKKEKGTGLGLYMSKTIVEKHLNGTLRWENRDDGACFIVSLPIKDEEETVS